MTRSKAEKICLGQVLGAHGVRGLVRVKPFTEEPDGVAAYGPVETKDGKRFKIEVMNIVKDAVLCRLDGIADRDQAEALRGTQFFVSRDRLPAGREGEWYQADLIGLEVRDGQGHALGEIVAIENFGAGNLFDIKLKVSGQNYFLPFTESYVPEVDLTGGFVVIDPPQGWDEQSDKPEGERDE